MVLLDSFVKVVVTNSYEREKLDNALYIMVRWLLEDILMKCKQILYLRSSFLLNDC